MTESIHDKPFLLAFGGYNGKYINKISVLKPSLDGDNSEFSLHDNPLSFTRIQGAPLSEEEEMFDRAASINKLTNIPLHQRQNSITLSKAESRSERTISILHSKLFDMQQKVKILEDQLQYTNKRLIHMEKENKFLRKQLLSNGDS